MTLARPFQTRQSPELASDEGVSLPVANPSIVTGLRAAAYGLYNCPVRRWPDGQPTTGMGGLDSLAGRPIGSDPRAPGGRSARREVLLTAMALVAICAGGLALRWQGLDGAEFNFDQAWSLNRAYDFVAHGQSPFHGEISSVGVPHWPVEILLLALPLLVSRDPVVATAYVGLLQMLAVAGTYWLGARYFDRTVGLAAATLYAVNPWAVTFSRKLWPPSMTPVLTLLFFVALHLAVVERRRYAMAAACALATALCLTHPSGVVFVPLLLIVVVAFWRRLGLRPLALGIVLAAIVASPYIYYDSQQDFAYIRAYANVTAAGEASVDLSSLDIVTKMASDRGLRELLPGAYGEGYVAPLLGSLDALAMALLLVGVVVASCRLVARLPWRRSGKGEGWEQYLLLLLWLAIPIATTLRHSLALSEPYFIAVWPVQFLSMGVGLSWATGAAWRLPVGRRLFAGRQAAAGAVLLVLLLALSQASYLWASLYNAENLGPRLAWGIPVKYSVRAIETIRDLRSAFGRPKTYVYCSHNQWVGLSYLARPDLPLEKVEPPQQMVLPLDLSAGLLFVVASNDAAAPPLGFAAVDDHSPIISEARELGFHDLPERSISGPGGRLYYRFLYLPPDDASAALSLFEPTEAQLALGNGLTLVGLRHSRSATPGATLAISTLWRMPENPATYDWLDYIFFAHLVDRTGRVLAQQDWEMFQYRLLWRADEYLVARYEMPVPADWGPGLAWLDLGAYERYSREQAPWVERSGGRGTSAPVGKVGPIRIAPEAETPPPQREIGAAFGAELELVGYDLSTADPAAGSTLDVALYWRSRRRMAVDYVVSVQLIGEDGRLVAQHDSPPVAGDYPTRFWEPGDEVRDTHRLTLPPTTAARRCRLVVVVYAAQSGERLPVADGDHLLLTTLTVKAADR